MLADHRPPAVAGTFYPEDPAELARTVDDYLGDPELGPAPKALVVPHAGYIYSGLTAGRGFATLRGAAERIERVVLVGPAHRASVKGLVSPGARFMDTPLGPVEVDVQALARVREITESPYAHAIEHSLEVELPFLRRMLPNARVVPLAAGSASTEAVATVLDALWGGPETVVIISTDLSHYLPYAQAKMVDSETVGRIVALDGSRIDHERACGATGLRGLLEVARRKSLTPRLIDMRTSGDTAGDKARVVGYASIAFYEPGALAARMPAS